MPIQVRNYNEFVSVLNQFNQNRVPPVPIGRAGHADFWNHMTEQQFLTGVVPDESDDNGNPIRICKPGDGEGSAIIQALRGAPGTMFDPLTGSARRMPADGGAFMPDDAINALSAWISAQRP